ncbi:conjugal transfer pilus assembly protein TraI [Ralstonia sp. 151470066-2]|uniref:MobH family relaxase n=1 Tax=Ralstonia TaxID=48736 RepID=UPI0035BF109A
MEQLIDSQSQLMGRIRTVAGGADDEFNEMYMSVISNLAAYVHLLPASRLETHTGAGGLFRLSLEMGFYSLQASEGVIFTPTEGVERRHKLEPRWRYAAFLAGLCCELHRPLASLIVSGPGGVQWPKYLSPLHKWCTDHGFENYYISWQPEPRAEWAGVKAEVSAMISKIVPDKCLQYLEAGSPTLAPIVFSVATGVARDNENAVAELVTRIRKRVLDRDKAVRPEYYGTLTVGNHLEPHLLEAMRTLIRESKWTINQEGGRVWYGTDGLYVIWKKAADELSKAIDEKGIRGVPSEANTLAEALLNAKVFVGKSDRDPYWKVILPNGKEYQATKLANPLTVLGDIEVAPLPHAIGNGAGGAPNISQQAAAQTLAPATVPTPAASPASAEATTTADPKAGAGSTQQALARAENEAVSTPAAQTASTGPAGVAPEKLHALMSQQAQARSAMRTLEPTELESRSAEEAAAERAEIGGAPITADPVQASERRRSKSNSKSSATVEKASNLDARVDARAKSDKVDGARLDPPITEAGAPSGLQNARQTAAPSQTLTSGDQTDFSYAQFVPEQFRAKYKPFLAETLGKLISDYRSGDHQAFFLLDRDGLCVSFKYAGTLGAPLPALIDELDRLNLLYVDPKNPGKKQHQRRLPGSEKDTPCLVLAAHAAQHLGVSA